MSDKTREKRIEQGVGTKLFVNGWDENGKLTFAKKFLEEYYEACIQLPKKPPPPPLRQSLVQEYFKERERER